MALFAGASVRQSRRRNSEVAHFGLLFFPSSKGTLKSLQTLTLGFHAFAKDLRAARATMPIALIHSGGPPSDPPFSRATRVSMRPTLPPRTATRGSQQMLRGPSH